MIKIGLDLSINSTGICVDNEGVTKYYIISSSESKVYKNYKDEKDILNIILYKKEKTEKCYSNNEYNKSVNLYRIVKEIENIIKENKPDIVRIEGISYSSNGSVVDLSGLNYMTRQMLIDNNIKFEIVSPTSNKKSASGNGCADKDLMIYSWLLCDKKMNEVLKKKPKSIKVDDIADAYFLANFT